MGTVTKGELIMDKTNFEKWRELKNDKQIKDDKRKKALFDKVNFMSLGCESDYERLFKNKKILILNSTVGTTAFGSAVAPLYIAKVAYPEQFADVDADTITREFYQKYWGEALPGTWRYYE